MPDLFIFMQILNSTSRMLLDFLVILISCQQQISAFYGKIGVFDGDIFGTVLIWNYNGLNELITYALPKWNSNKNDIHFYNIISLT